VWDGPPVVRILTSLETAASICVAPTAFLPFVTDELCEATENALSPLKATEAATLRKGDRCRQEDLSTRSRREEVEAESPNTRRCALTYLS